MPLSEDEQRILSQIEQQLWKSDPALAREVGSTTVYTHAARNIRWAVVGFVGGLALMLVTLTMSYWLAFLGFLVMVGAALYFERNARRLGRAGMQQLSQSMRSANFRGVGGSMRDRLRGSGEEPDDL